MHTARYDFDCDLALALDTARASARRTTLRGRRGAGDPAAGCVPGARAHRRHRSRADDRQPLAGTHAGHREADARLVGRRPRRRDGSGRRRARRPARSRVHGHRHHLRAHAGDAGWPDPRGGSGRLAARHRRHGHLRRERHCRRGAGDPRAGSRHVDGARDRVPPERGGALRLPGNRTPAAPGPGCLRPVVRAGHPRHELRRGGRRPVRSAGAGRGHGRQAGAGALDRPGDARALRRTARAPSTRRRPRAAD